MCIKENGDEPAAVIGGDKCAKCINTVASNVYKDMGCTDDKPVCILDSKTNQAPFLGKAGFSCVENNLPVSMMALMVRRTEDSSQAIPSALWIKVKRSPVGATVHLVFCA